MSHALSCYLAILAKDGWMTAAREPTKEGGDGVRMMNIGIDVGKKAMQVCMKDDPGKIVDELSLSNDSFGAEEMINIVNGMSDRTVIETTGNHWVRLYDALTENGIATKLANPIRTRMIAEARIKNDKTYWTSL